MRSIQWLGLLLAAVILLLCGCGGGPAPIYLQPPSALSYTTATAVYTQGMEITPNNPTSGGGAVAAYSVSPSLPAGLVLSTITGVISGTPTAAAAMATFTVTASNSAGSATASLSITVMVAAPAGLSYTTGAAVYTVGTTVPANSPSSTGGTVASYSVSPALPAGLSLSTTTGILSGTPTAVTATAGYTVTASNSAGNTTATLAITVNAAPLSADNINLIFVVSQDLAYQDQAFGDVNPSTANLTNKGLQRSLLMAPFLQQVVLGMNNVTGIYTLEPMTHLQTPSNYPDMAALETIQQFALLNQISLPAGTGGLTQFIGNSYPLNASYGFGFAGMGEIAAPLLFCYSCQGLDFNDQNNPNGDNESVIKGIIAEDAPGFYVFSAPWETASTLLANINLDEGYNLTVPASYQGPNYIYAISIPPSGTASLVTYNSNLNPPSTYPVLPAPGVVSSPCTAQTAFSIPTTGSIPPPSKGFNTDEIVYFIRHAEAHPTTLWDDGNMVAAGQWRALDLPNALAGKISPTQVYSIDPAQVIPYGYSYFPYVRPSLTVEPYVIANNLPLNLVANIEIFAPDSPQLTSGFFFNCCAFSGQTVLLAWEHDHFPAIVDALLKSYGSTQTAPAWPGDDYDTIWRVTLDSNSNLTIDNALCEGINSAKLPATAPQF
ncbi:MAG: Ig domain-containing protein [Terriglobia bacterium]